MTQFLFTHVDGRVGKGDSTFEAIAAVIGVLQAHEVFAARAYMTEWAVSLEEGYARAAGLYDEHGELIGTFKDLY